MSRQASTEKRRANGEGSIRQRKDDTWEARFVTGINPGAGKEIRKSAGLLQSGHDARQAEQDCEGTKVKVSKVFPVRPAALKNFLKI